MSANIPEGIPGMEQEYLDGDFFFNRADDYIIDHVRPYEGITWASAVNIGLFRSREAPAIYRRVYGEAAG